jgi:ribosomal protein L37AE/L43A
MNSTAPEGEDLESLRVFYDPSEITECPRCGSTFKNPKYTSCWHCNECDFAICAYYKFEVDEIRNLYKKD